jgi:T-complex protein 1 subunit gamma
MIAPKLAPLNPCKNLRRAALLKLEEEFIERQCADIARHKPDLVVTEKGLSDLAMHFLTKAGIAAIRRLRKTDNNRIARATGATIVHRCCLALPLRS